MLGLVIRHRVRGPQVYFSLIEAWPTKDCYLAFLGVAFVEADGLENADGFWRSIRFKLGSARLALDGVTVDRLLADIAALLVPAATVATGVAPAAPTAAA